MHLQLYLQQITLIYGLIYDSFGATDFYAFFRFSEPIGPMGLRNGKKAEDLEKCKMCVLFVIQWFVNQKSAVFGKFIENQDGWSGNRKRATKITIFMLAGLLVGFCKKCAEKVLSIVGILHRFEPEHHDIDRFEHDFVRFDEILMHHIVPHQIDKIL